MNSGIDFGYPWWLSYGHIIILLPVAVLLFIGYKRRWSGLFLAALSVIGLWSFAALLAARFVLNINGPAPLPTATFLQSGEGRVLDMGAGTGRSSIMVLQDRPRTTLVALDEFGRSYAQHFGTNGSPEQRLLSNFKAAGVADRATVQAGDMRKLPYKSGEFDAIVSAYAIDHLNTQGVKDSLSEAARVLKPKGEFLLMIIGKDPWLNFTFGPLLVHSHTRGPDWWDSRITEAGFRIVEQGVRPGTLYFLAQRP